MLWHSFECLKMLGGRSEKKNIKTMGVFVYLMIKTNQDRTEKTENEDQ